MNGIRLFQFRTNWQVRKKDGNESYSFFEAIGEPPVVDDSKDAARRSRQVLESVHQNKIEHLPRTNHHSMKTMVLVSVDLFGSVLLFREAK